MKVLIAIIALALALGSAQTARAHCDTMDGPVVKDTYKALQENNVNHILKWIRADEEGEIKAIFLQAAKVRQLGNEAKQLAEKYLIENLIRVHRAGEGVPYDGVKPSGTPVDKAVLAADEAIEKGSISPLQPLVPKEKLPKLSKLFSEVMRLKNYDVNDVKAGRDYVEAYVQFFHFAEGEEESHASHAAGIGHLVYEIPIVLSAIFLITSAIFIILYYRARKKAQ